MRSSLIIYLLIIDAVCDLPRSLRVWCDNCHVWCVSATSTRALRSKATGVDACIPLHTFFDRLLDPGCETAIARQGYLYAPQENQMKSAMKLGRLGYHISSVSDSSVRAPWTADRTSVSATSGLTRDHDSGMHEEVLHRTCYKVYYVRLGTWQDDISRTSVRYK